jgi:hypothetical protein
MKHTTSAKPNKPMSLKKLADPASKAFWDFVEKSTEDWRQQQPAWSRELEREHRTGNELHLEPRTADDVKARRVG